MNEMETLETSVAEAEDASPVEGEALVAEEVASATAETEEARADEAESTEARGADSWAEEADALREIYPTFDLEEAMAHPVLGRLLRGEGQPTLRQLYEAVHWESIAEARATEVAERAVASEMERAVSAAVTAAVAEAVRESEARLLENIRARGQRPTENGTNAAVGVRMHPAVERLTRRERAMLAKRAERGEHIQL